MNQFTPKNINNNPNLIKGNLEVTGDLLVDGDSQIVGDSIVDGNSLTIGNATFSHNLTVSGSILNVPTGSLNGRLTIPASAIITVPTNQNYEVLVTDRIIQLNSTAAGSKLLTLGDLGSSVFQLTIILLTATDGDYNFNCLQGNIILAFSNFVKTVLHLGNGNWTLLTTQS